MKDLKQAEIERLSAKHPNFPAHYIAGLIKPYTDKTSNGLTRCVIELIQSKGYQAERISNTGRWIDDSKIVTDTVGTQRKIGSGKYIKGSGTNGTADISAIIEGRAVKIEIKVGKDIQSEAQKEYQAIVEKSKGIYLIVKNYADFKEWFINFTK